jgi:hypothetical protein
LAPDLDDFGRQLARLRAFNLDNRTSRAILSYILLFDFEAIERSQGQGQGSMLQNTVSAENFSEKFSLPNFGQISAHI